MPTCGNTFDGQHHYAPRQFGSRETGNLRTVLACVCSAICPDNLRAEVLAALRATEAEKERQHIEVMRMSHPKHPLGAVMERLL